MIIITNSIIIRNDKSTLSEQGTDSILRHQMVSSPMTCVERRNGQDGLNAQRPVGRDLCLVHDDFITGR